jgi:hypothetical protein
MRTAPWVVLELEMQERPPLTLENINGRPLRGGVGAGGPGAPTINAVEMSTVGPL